MRRLVGSFFPSDPFTRTHLVVSLSSCIPVLYLLHVLGYGSNGYIVHSQYIHVLRSKFRHLPF